MDSRGGDIQHHICKVLPSLLLLLLLLLIAKSTKSNL
jgi:hypothetical protein